LRLSRDKRYAAAGNNSNDAAAPPSAKSIAKMTHDRVVTMQGLEGIRIAELGHLVSAAYATKIMADLGADVVKVEEPTGDVARTRGPFPGGIADPEKSGLFLYLNTNKRGVTLDLTDPRERPQLERIAEWAEIVVHNYAPKEMAARGLDYERLRAINPRLVLCSITPFGLTGPHRDYRAEEITMAHGGGWAWVAPGASDRPDLPPLKAFGHQCDFHAGMSAAVASLGAYFRALASGRGEHVDLSVQAHVASFIEQNLVYFTYCEKVASRLGQRLLFPWGIFECADGLIFLVIVEDDQWRRLVELMGNPEWASWEIFRGLVGRADNADVMKPYITEWTRQWKVADLFRAGQERRVCFAPVFTMAALADEAQLRARGFFVEVDHPRSEALRLPGPPYRLHDPWWRIRRPAPRLGEHNREMLASRPNGASAAQSSAPGPRAEQPLPLAGVRVVDFSWVWAGPFCAMQLAHLGAEVIRLESQARPDAARRLPITPAGMEPGLNRSGYFNQWNQGKQSALLNLAAPGAIEIARRLIAKSDVVVENFATGVMERLGLSYEDLRQVKPDIIMVSISGYGHTGPQRSYMGYGPAIVPLSGLASLTGYPGGPPAEVGISYGDPTGGITAAAGVLAALVVRRRTGRGQHIDLALWEATAALVAEGWMEFLMSGRLPERIGNRDPLLSPCNCFRASGEDAWVTIACATDREWQALCGVIGRTELASDPRFAAAADRKANEDALEAEITAWTQTRDRWEITRALQAAGVAAFPSMSSRDLVEDPHLNERGFFTRLEHAEVGVRAHAGVPWRFAETTNGVRSPAPLIGEHTDRVMRELLGMPAEEIARLRAEKVLY
jgi:crotonobetainyl-CoA:carnitine CoA-transferase CaiB-like acyl-CoA transferase